MNKQEILEYQIAASFSMSFLDREEDISLNKTVVEDIFQWVFQGNTLQIKEGLIKAIIGILSQSKFSILEENKEILEKIEKIEKEDLYYDKEGLLKIKNI